MKTIAESKRADHSTTFAAIDEFQIGSKLRKLRKDRGWCLKQVGHDVGISVSHLSRIETGYEIPPLFSLVRLAKAFSVPVNYFFEGGKASEAG